MQLISKLDRYIGVEILRIFIAILVILVLILIGSTFVKMLNMAASGAISPNSVMILMGLETLRLSGRLVPAAFFFATVMALGRMYQEHEMSALFSSGISPFRLVGSSMLIALPVVLASVWLTLVISPVSGRVIAQVYAQNQDALMLSALEPGRFHEAREGELIYYSGLSPSGQGDSTDIFIHQKKTDGTLRIIKAKDAQRGLDPETGLQSLILQAGHQYEGKVGEAEMRLVDFDELHLQLGPQKSGELRARMSQISTRDLLNTTQPAYRVELQSRLLFPLSVIAFGLLAIPLSRSSARKSAYARVIFAVFVYIIFKILSDSAETWMLKNVTPQWMGMWWVIALMLALTIAMLFFDQYRFRWRGWLRAKN